MTWNLGSIQVYTDDYQHDRPRFLVKYVNLRPESWLRELKAPKCQWPFLGGPLTEDCSLFGTYECIYIYMHFIYIYMYAIYTCIYAGLPCVWKLRQEVLGPCGLRIIGS